MITFGSCLMLLLTFGLHVQAAEDEISENTWITGNTDSNTVDYYELHLPAPGRVTITYQSFLSYGNCDLYDKDLTKMYQGVRISGSSAAPATREFSVDLNAGEYRLKLFGANGGTQPKKPSNYRMKFSFAPVENNETEPNNSFQTAMPLADRALIQGFLSEDDSIDFYKFTIGEETRVKVTVGINTLSKYQFSVWNADLIRGGSFSNVTSPAKVWEKKLSPGTYYIKVNESTRTGSYTLKWEGIHYVENIQLNAEAIVMKQKASYSLLKAVLPANAE